MESLRIALKFLKDLWMNFDFGYGERKFVERLLRNWRFNEKAQIEYLTDFLTWIEDGNNPVQAAMGVVAGFEGAESKPVQCEVSDSIVDALTHGFPMVEGMRDWFNDDICALFESAKDTEPQVILKMLTEFLGQQRLLKSVKDSLVKPIMLPLIYSSLAFVGLYAMMINFLPMFFEIVPLNYWSSYTQSVYALMLWLQSYYLLLFIAITAMVLFIKHQLRTNTSKIRFELDNYYPLSLYKNITAMKLMKFIGILVMMADNPGAAIRRVLVSSSRWESYHLNKMLDSIDSGEQNIAKIMDTGLLSKAVLYRLASIANVSSDEIKKVAISHAADRSAGEIVKGMKSVTALATVLSWGLVLLVMATFVIQFASIFGAMQNVK